MSQVSLTLESGRTTGSPESRRLRRVDSIPAVVYGNGVGPISVTVNRRDLRLALTGEAGNNALLNLTIDGAVHPAVVKELQRDKVRRTVNHVDFLVVNLKEQLEVEVPIVLVGEAKLVIAEGGMVDPQINTLTISTTPANIPSEISIDITNMAMGDTITVADLTLPVGCSTPVAGDVTVVSTIDTREAPEEVAGEAAAE